MCKSVNECKNPDNTLPTVTERRGTLVHVPYQESAVGRGDNTTQLSYFGTFYSIDLFVVSLAIKSATISS